MAATTDSPLKISLVISFLALNIWPILQMLRDEDGPLCWWRASVLTWLLMINSWFMIELPGVFDSKLIDYLLRDRSQITCRGWWCKQLYCKNLFVPNPFIPQKISGPPFALKITGQPHRKACKLNFYWIFFKGPLTRVKKFEGPLFASGPPNKCLWTVPNIIINVVELCLHKFW